MLSREIRSEAAHYGVDDTVLKCRNIHCKGKAAIYGKAQNQISKAGKRGSLRSAPAAYVVLRKREVNSKFIGDVEDHVNENSNMHHRAGYRVAVVL